MCSLDKPNSKSFKEQVVCLQSHLQLKPTVIAERYKFHQRVKGPSETVEQYLKALCKHIISWAC